MIRLALKPLPRHEDLARVAKSMLRNEPAMPSRKQAHEVNVPSQIAPEDWDKLFHAVEHRLSGSVCETARNDEKTRVTVRECVDALNQLHNALTHERQQRQQAQ